MVELRPIEHLKVKRSGPYVPFVLAPAAMHTSHRTWTCTSRGIFGLLFLVLEILKLMFSRFLAVFEGHAGFKQLRATCRIDFHQSSYVVWSYKEKKVRLNFLKF